MVKYARFVFEIIVPDDMPVDQAAGELDARLQEYITNNTVLASDIEIAEEPYYEDGSRENNDKGPNHSIIYPMWVLDRDDIIESARRVGVKIEENDFDEIIKTMRSRIADTIGDAWDEILDQEVLATKGEV